MAGRPTDRMAEGPDRRLRDTRAFLKMAAIELRRLAEREPEIADELRDVAQKLDDEAGDLGRRYIE